jgi:hypothetical protein
VIRARRVHQLLPLLEQVLAEFGRRATATDDPPAADGSRSSAHDCREHSQV